MSSANQYTLPQRANSRALLRVIVSGALGAAFAYGAMRLAIQLHVHVKALSWSDLLALVVGISFFGFGVIAFVVSANRRALARSLEGETAQLPATDEEVGIFRLQAAVLVLAGILMLSPIFALGPMQEYPRAGAGAFAGIVLLLAVQTWMNIRIWRSSDEFVRTTLLVVAAITFAIGQGLLFLWAAAERLHLFRSITSWDVLTVLMAFYLAVSILVSLRRMR